MIFLESCNKVPEVRVQVIFKWSLITAIVLIKHYFLRLFRSLILARNELINLTA